jgi:hypothetical protein
LGDYDVADEEDFARKETTQGKGDFMSRAE